MLYALDFICQARVYQIIPWGQDIQFLSGHFAYISADQVQGMNHVMRKPTWFPNRSDTNLAVQALKMARGWKFWIKKAEE